MDPSSSPFVRVKDVSCAIDLLESRLPKSCHIFNMAMMHEKFKDVMTFYSLNSGMTSDSWIVATFLREDYTIDINISAPENLHSLDEFQNALVNSKLVNWDEPYIFAAVDRKLSHMLRHLSIDIKGNSTGVNPGVMFYRTRESCAQMDFPSRGGIEVKSLDSARGKEFFAKTWKFFKEGSLPYITKLLDLNPSSGVFLQNSDLLVSGVTVAGSGMMSMLHTLEPYRRQGYGQICMEFHMKNLVSQGLVPCGTVEFKNEVSKRFLETRCGMQISHEADYVFYNGSTF